MPILSPVSLHVKYGNLLATSSAALLRPNDAAGAVGKGCTIKNCSHLEGQTAKIVYIGDSTVTAYNGSAIRATDGTPLGPGDVLSTSSLAEIYAVCASGDTCWVNYFEDLA